MLIDGNSLTYRAFFALPTDMSTASGQVTNAVFGFTSMLINLVRDHQPDLLAVTFDRPEPTFRHERLDTYKANRESAPDILRQQMGLVRQLVETIGLPIIEVVGFEADDVIATIATRAKGEDIATMIVTGDRDSYQLVEDPFISVLYNKRGVSDYALYDEAGILERTGVRPDQYVWYAALRGDPSDNLPGVPGVGEKTAAKLVSTYGDLDGIFANAGAQTPKLRSNLIENEEKARTNAEMMRLVRDVPLEFTFDDFTMPTPDAEAVRTLFGQLEFGSLTGRFAEAFEGGSVDDGPQLPVIEAEVQVLDAPGAVAALDAVAGRGAPAVMASAWAGSPGTSELTWLAVVLDAEAAEVAVIEGGIAALPAVTASLGALMSAVPVVAHDAKPLLRWLLGRDLPRPEVALDTKIAAYLLDPADARYALAELVERYAGAELASGEAAQDGQLDFGGDDNSSVTLGREALAVAVVWPKLVEALEHQGLTGLNENIELPLIGVLARMEHIGVGVDIDELRSISARLASECDRLRELIYAGAGGEPFNVNSTPQLREVLFDRLGLKPQKKTKTGYSTDAQSLEKLRGQHPIIDHLLDYREVEKLRSTYGEGLISAVQPDGRIHATFTQTVARTGRLSSESPNLHNIPVRSEEGRLFRRAFVPAEGFQLLVADYNQIELRCIAHLAEDPGLIEAFTTGADIHDQTASRIFAVESGKVTVEQRSKAKMVSYGLAYGMEAYGLAQRLNIETAEARDILEAYFIAFPSVRAYMDRTVAEARERGYTETLLGRRRKLPDLQSGNYSVRLAAERQAMNAGIQGLAADIFKLALVRLDRALAETGGRTRLILQVHDEVVCEVTPDEHESATGIVLEAMTGAFHLRVPLEVNLAFGANWADAKA